MTALQVTSITLAFTLISENYQKNSSRAGTLLNTSTAGIYLKGALSPVVKCVMKILQFK